MTLEDLENSFYGIFGGDFFNSCPLTFKKSGSKQHDGE